MIGREFKNRILALEFWRKMKSAYQVTFKTEHGGAVLRDLADFCHVFKTTEDPQHSRLSALREGRRQVFLRILHHLNLSQEQLSALYRDAINDSGEG